MKTVNILFAIGRAEQVAILLYSLELKIIMTWSNDGDLFSEGYINCICKLNESNKSITPELQLEKLRERNYIKIKP